MLNYKKFKTMLFVVLFSLILGFAKEALAGEIILNDATGQAVNLSSYKGKPVILLFWTTWCPYCRQELINLNQQHAQIAKEGIVVFGVNVNESESKVRKFFKESFPNFKILLDKDGLLSRKYDLMGVPTYIFLDKAGEVISQAHSLPDNYKNLLLNETLK